MVEYPVVKVKISFDEGEGSGSSHTETSGGLPLADAIGLCFALCVQGAIGDRLALECLALAVCNAEPHQFDDEDAAVCELAVAFGAAASALVKGLEVARGEVL